MAAAGDNFNRAVEYVLDGPGFSIAKLVDEVHVDRLVRMTKMQECASRVGNGQPSGCHVRVARHEFWQYLRDAFDGFDNEVNAKILGECFGKIVFGAGGAVWPNRVGRRTVTRYDTQLTDFEYLLEYGGRRRTGTDQPCERDDD